MNVMRGDRKHAEAESTDGAGCGTLGRRSVLGGLAAIPVLSSIAGPVAAALAATGARNDLRDGLGPEFADFEIEALNPKRLAHKHLFGDLNADQPEQARHGDCPHSPVRGDRNDGTSPVVADHRWEVPR